jgi:hypothetical protein
VVVRKQERIENNRGRRYKSITTGRRDFNSEEICFRKEYTTSTIRPRKDESYFTLSSSTSVDDNAL